jgi:DegV family protein with EDD domain
VRPGKERNVGVRVVTDSTADLSPEVAADLGVTVVPLMVRFGNEVFRDGIDLSSDEFFERLSESAQLPSTSQPPVGAFQEAYERLAPQRDDIVSVHVSGKLSGTVNAAATAARLVQDRCRVDVVDSLSLSMGLGLGVIAAARVAQAGGTVEEVAEAARAVAQRHTLVAMFESLEYLQKGGRIGRAKAFLGSVLQLRPLVTLVDGEIHPLLRERTRAKALERMFEHCVSREDISDVAIMHTTTPDDAHDLAERVRQRLPEARVHMGRVGPALGAYGGPGTMGMAVA